MPATLHDVAQTAGVSVATASRVLNGATLSDRVSRHSAQRVREAAQRVGYTAGYHRRAIRSGRSETLGVALDIASPEESANTWSVLNNPFYSGLIAGVEQATHARGYNMAVVVPSKTRRANRRR